MNKGFIFTLGVIAGAAIGSLITWKYVEEKYKQIADEEVESVIETFKKRATEFKSDIVENDKDKDNDKDEYKDKVHYLGYCTENDEQVYDEEDEYTVNVEEREEGVEPYVISPEEFGEHDDYKTVSLICYEDMVVTNDDDEIIDDVENLIGDALDHFGDYEDDAVHVRNENNKCDYEILKSEKLFSEINKEDI